MSAAADRPTALGAARPRPPAWLIAATGLLAITCLMLAVAETNLRAHYLIDQGEYVSLFGLAFILISGLVLFANGRLLVSLPLIFPWLLYPVITQGDQIIDNMSINSMRLVCHVLLAAIFGTPVAVIVLGVRHLLSPRTDRRAAPPGWTALVPGLRPLSEGRVREGSALLAAALLAAEIWLADQYLGTLMIVTLIVMIFGVLLYGSWTPGRTARAAARSRTERFALAVLVAGVALSFGAFYGYKNRPGAYQGSPSFFMDPSQADASYRLDRIAVPSRPPAPPASPEAVRAALAAYARTLERLLAGYHLLDRNYTYDFHNELFVRRTPLVADYREVGLRMVAEARELRADADRQAAAARATLAADDPLTALLDDLRDYVAFNFDRAPVLERMTAVFERTPAGLQHAAHLYEGEGKFLGSRLAEIVQKHHAVVESSTSAPVTSEFQAASRALYDAYAHHIVGF